MKKKHEEEMKNSPLQRTNKCAILRENVKNVISGSFA
jgi:hypothetical protein